MDFGQITDFVKNNQTVAILGTAGMASFATSYIQQIKNIPRSIVRYIREKFIVDFQVDSTSPMFPIVQGLIRDQVLNRRYTNYRFSEGSKAFYISPKDHGANVLDNGVVIDRLGNRSDCPSKITMGYGAFYFIYKGVLIRCKKGEKKTEQPGGPVGERYQLPGESIELLQFTAFTFNLKAALTIARDAIEQRVSDATPGIDVYYATGFSSANWRYFGKRPPRSIDSIVTDDPHALEELVQRCKKFDLSQEEYTKRGQPWKLVICLEGPPGTGKSSIAKMLATELRRNLRSLGFSSVKNEANLIEMFANSDASDIILIEDLDSNGFAAERSQSEDAREAQGKKGISMSSLINCMDGVLSPHGTIIIWSTNRYERIDTAITREQRTGITLHVGNLGRAAQRRLAAKYGIDWQGQAEPIVGAKLSSILQRANNVEDIERMIQEKSKS